MIDLWEHAYYLDHQRARKAYLEAVTARHLNCDFAAEAFLAESVDALDLGIGIGIGIGNAGADSCEDGND